MGDEPVSNSYNIRLFVYYNQTSQPVQSTWNSSKARFLIEISPKEGVICIRLLTVRSDKVDHIDENIFKMNMFSFIGNLVSIEPYKLTLAEETLYEKDNINNPEQRNKFYFAYKTSTDIGIEDENVRKLIMIMDYLVASQKAI